VVADSFLAFAEGRTSSALRETPEVITRMTAFKPGIVGPRLLWPLLALTVIGIPAGILWAAWKAAGA
jgi:hypothetical protein